MSDNNTNIEELFRQAVAAATTTSTGDPNSAPPPPAAPEPLKVKLMGQDYTFKDMAEYNAAVEKTLTDQAQRINSMQSVPPSGSQATGKEAPESAFSLDRYSQLIAEGHIEKAENYKLGAMLFRDGNIPGLDVLRDTIQKASAVADTVQAEAFKSSNPTFNAAKHGGVVEDVRARLNLPRSADGYDAAYSLAIKRGLIEPPVPVPAKTTTPLPPPAVGRNGSTQSAPDGAFHEKLMTMPLEDLEKALRSVKAIA